jgi:hypothetical protein
MFAVVPIVEVAHALDQWFYIHHLGDARASG